MKKNIVLVLLVSLLFFNNAFACDICGCGNGSSFVGLLPRSGNALVGIRHQTSRFTSHGYSNFYHTEETYQTTELWGRFFPAKKLQTLVFLPYRQNERYEVRSSTNTQNKGLGDAIILAHYNVFNSFLDSTNTSGISQNLMLGGGVKLPTGKFEETFNSEAVNPNYQLGTGSTDFLLSAIYLIKYKNWGINTELGSRITTKNKDDYQFGNRINGAIKLFYVKNINLFSVMPNAGIMVDYATQDKQKSSVVMNTGGHLVASTFGLETYLKKVNIGFNYQMPLVEKLGGGEIKAKSQFQVHLSLNL